MLMSKRGNPGFGRLTEFILGVTVCVTWYQGYSQMVREKFVVPITHVIRGVTTLIIEIGKPGC